MEAAWEKAAGVWDGRLYPWGNAFDPSYCNMVSSHSENPTITGPGRISNRSLCVWCPRHCRQCLRVDELFFQSGLGRPKHRNDVLQGRQSFEHRDALSTAHAGTWPAKSFVGSVGLSSLSNALSRLMSRYISSIPESSMAMQCPISAWHIRPTEAQSSTSSQFPSASHS